jgi:hypothetical protein
VVDAQGPDCHAPNYKICRQIKHLPWIKSPSNVNALDYLVHLLSFLAPAFAVALLVAVLGRWLLPRAARPGWRASLAINFLAGAAALAAGLWYFGHDGKMASYAAMVLAVATAEWLAARAWQG